MPSHVCPGTGPGPFQEGVQCLVGGGWWRLPVLHCVLGLTPWLGCHCLCPVSCVWMGLRLQVVSCFPVSQDWTNWKDMSGWYVQQAGEEREEEGRRREDNQKEKGSRLVCSVHICSRGWDDGEQRSHSGGSWQVTLRGASVDHTTHSF